MRKTLIVAGFVALLISGCDKKAEGQTVAVVNGEEITAAELNAELARLNVGNTSDKDKARAQVLQALVDRRLLAQQAKSDGIDKSPEYVSRERRADEDLLISMMAQRQLNTAKLPTPEAIAAFQAAHPEMFAKRETWDLDQIYYQAPSDAATIKKLAEAHSLEEVAAALTQGGVAFNRGKNRLSTAVIPHDIYTRLTSVPSTEPFIIPAPTGNSSVASVVTARTPAPLSADAARSLAVQAIRQTDGQKFMETRLKSLRGAAKIEYQPGFAPKP